MIDLPHPYNISGLLPDRQIRQADSLQACSRHASGVINSMKMKAGVINSMKMKAGVHDSQVIDKAVVTN